MIKKRIDMFLDNEEQEFKLDQLSKQHNLDRHQMIEKLLLSNEGSQATKPHRTHFFISEDAYKVYKSKKNGAKFIRELIEKA